MDNRTGRCLTRSAARHSIRSPDQAAALGRAFHASVPGGQILALGVEGLADVGKEVDEGEQKDIGHSELVAGDERLGAHQAVEPLELVPCRGLQPVGGFRDATDAILEPLQPFGKAKAVGGGFDDVEVDAARSHARFSAFLRCIAD